jgi:hypothetical protein
VLVIKKGLKFTKEQLEDLYLRQKLSINKIGEKFGCEGTNILYWLKKFEIKRRPAIYRSLNLSREVLYDLYTYKKLSSLQIAKKLGIKHSKSIRKNLKRFGIQTRSLSEACTIKFKAPFSKDLSEKAFMLGMRTGDFYARKKNLSIRVQTTSTHNAMIDFFYRCFPEIRGN